MTRRQKYGCFLESPHSKPGFRLTVVIFLLLFPVINLFAIEETNKDADSVRKEFPPITVTAGRITSSRANASSAVSVINKSEITRTGAWQVNDALQYTSGIYIKNYGGLGGMKTVSLRGTSSQQTLVMLDGFRLNSSQNGTTDLSILPLSFLDNIEVVKGGQSAVYGGNAIGGVINLVTERAGKKEISGSFSYGSFGELLSSFSAGYPLGNTYLSSSLEYQSSKGSYPIETNQMGKLETLTRTNADFSNLSMTLAARTIFNNWLVSSRLLLRSSGRGVPGAVLQNVIESKSRLDEDNALLILSTSGNLGNTTNISFGLSGNYGQSFFKSPDLPGEDSLGLADSYFNRELQAYSRLTFSFFDYSTELNAEYSFANLGSNRLQFNPGNYVSRNSLGLSARTESPAFDLGNINFSYQAALRFDAVENTGTAVSPEAGFVLSGQEMPLSIRIQWSYNFRPPNFNEMYYRNFGNTDLRPERANSVDASFSWSPLESLSLSAGGFIINTKDQIIAIPKSPVVWTAANLASVVTKGLELNAAGDLLDKKLDFSISYTLESATDESPNSLAKGRQIVYSPNEIISGMTSLNLPVITAGVGALYSGFRYSMPDNSIESLLPSYFILNAYIARDIKVGSLKLNLRLEANNILDERYEVIANYPMPGRSFRAGVSLIY